MNLNPSEAGSYASEHTTGYTRPPDSGVGRVGTWLPHLTKTPSLLIAVPLLLSACGSAEASWQESQVVPLTQSPKVTEPRWVVKILYPVGNQNMECTASVLNERWLLTSAHCLQGSGSSDFWMYPGSGTPGNARFYRHPQDDEDETAHDVGLVYLQQKPLDISKTSQAKLFTDGRRPWRDDNEPDEFAMSAYGLGSDPGGTSNCDDGTEWTHRQATFEVDCDSDSDHATARSNLATHACPRDSGAPWMLRRGGDLGPHPFMLFAVFKGQSDNFSYKTEHAALLEMNLGWIRNTLTSVTQSTPYRNDCRALSLGGWSFQRCDLSPRGWAELVGLGDMCMTAMGTTDGSEVQLQICTKGWDQGWLLLPSGLIRSQANPLLCLDGLYNNGHMRMTTCATSGVTARFNLTTEPRLRLSYDWDRCVDAPPAFTTSGTPSEGTPVQSFVCSGTTSQRWTMRLLPLEVVAR